MRWIGLVTLMSMAALPAQSVGNEPACKTDSDDELCVAALANGIELLRLAVRDELYSNASRVRSFYMIRREGVLIQVPLIKQGAVVDAYSARTADCIVAALSLSKDGDRIHLRSIRRNAEIFLPQSEPAGVIVDEYVLVNTRQQIPGSRSVFFEHVGERRHDVKVCTLDEFLGVSIKGKGGLMRSPDRLSE